MNKISPIDNPNFLQLRFRVEFENEVCEVFATAPKNEKPSQDLVTVHLLGVDGDVMITPEDLDERTLNYFKAQAFGYWNNEVSFE